MNDAETEVAWLSFAVNVWSPEVAVVGTVNVAVNEPVESVVVVPLRGKVAPSKVAVIGELTAKPEPETVISVSVGLDKGVKVIDGAAGKVPITAYHLPLLPENDVVASAWPVDETMFSK